jgi:hypothetical protein
MTEKEYEAKLKLDRQKYPYVEGCKLEDVIVGQTGWKELSCESFVEWELKRIQEIFNSKDTTAEEKEDIMKFYEEDCGHKHPMRFPIAKNGIDRAIDKATGFDEERKKALWYWSVWVAVSYLSGMTDDLQFDDEGNMIFDKE